jgi:hypothetical protein
MDKIMKRDGESVVLQAPRSLSPCEMAALAITNRACLDDADLRCLDFSNTHSLWMSFKGADMRSVSAKRCSFFSADFRHADLWGANFDHSDLSGAQMRGARFGAKAFVHADIGLANFSGARLEHVFFGAPKTLVEDRPVLKIGPIGSRHDTLMAFFTVDGAYLSTGCFFGTAKDFAKAVNAEHAHDSKTRSEYRAALYLIKTRENLTRNPST